MLQFILGAWAGGVVGFAVCAICSMARGHNRNDKQCAKDLENNDAQE